MDSAHSGCNTMSIFRMVEGKGRTWVQARSPESDLCRLFSHPSQTLGKILLWCRCENHPTISGQRTSSVPSVETFWNDRWCICRWQWPESSFNRLMSSVVPQKRNINVFNGPVFKPGAVTQLFILWTATASCSVQLLSFLLLLLLL